MSNLSLKFGHFWVCSRFQFWSKNLLSLRNETFGGLKFSFGGSDLARKVLLVLYQIRFLVNSGSFQHYSTQQYRSNVLHASIF